MDEEKSDTVIGKVEDVLMEDVLAASVEERALVRRVDMILLPTLWFMYLFSYADRTNIGNAKIAGMMTDLHLSSDQYSLALVLFFIPYIVFQIPSSLILSKTRPSVYLPIIMTLWGVLTCCMAVVESKRTLYVVRFILGVLEAGFAPGVNLLLSTWYKKDEQAKRFSIFYSAAVLSGALGGIVAGAITGSLNGSRGIAGWRWLFIVEGAGTIACALISAFFLPDYPATTKRFTERERQLAVERLIVDSGAVWTEDGPEISSLQALRESLGNWRTWLFTIGYVAIGGSGTMSYFYPTLVAGLGYTSHMAQYMVVPIYSVAFVCVLITGYLNDLKPNHRGLVIAICLAVSMTCSIVICAVYNYKARYVLLVFLASALLSSNPLSLAYVSSSFASTSRDTRGVSLAFINAAANFSQIYGAYLFPSKDAPKYLLGFGVISGLCAVGVVTYSVLHVLVRKYPI